MTIKNLHQRSIRSYLTILSIVIGVSTVFILYHAGQGFQNGVEDQFSALGTKSVNIFPANLQGPPIGATGFDSNDMQGLEDIRNVKYRADVRADFIEVEYQREKLFLPVGSYETSDLEQNLADKGHEIAVGRINGANERGIVLLGSTIAAETFDNPIPLKSSVTIKDKKFRVIGIFKESGTPIDMRLYVHYEDAKEIFEFDDFLNYVALEAESVNDIPQIKADAQRLLEKRLDKDEFDISTAEDLLDQVLEILGVINAVIIFIAMISIIVGSFGIANSMFTSVLERTNEIGIYKAIGAQNKTVITMFLLESGILGLLGGLIGIILGGAFIGVSAIIIDQLALDIIRIEIDWLFTAGVLFGSILLGMAAGFVPAMRAAKLQPVEALRYE